MGKYKVRFGNRRLMACRKLGKKSIPAIIDGKVAHISTDDIEMTKNIRTKVGDVSGLMASIKERGLLQPIGLTTDVDSKEFLIDNTVENIQKKDISPIELGRACKELFEKHGLTFSEVGVKLGINKNKVADAVQLFNRVPEQFRNGVGYLRGGEAKKGVISVAVANVIVQSRVTKAMMEEIFKLSHKHELNQKQAILVCDFVSHAGLSPKKALKKIENIRVLNLKFFADRKMTDKMKKRYEGESLNTIASKMLKGDYPVEPNWVVYGV